MGKKSNDKSKDDMIASFFARLDMEMARVEAMACVLLTVLAVRGIEITDRDRDRIVGCLDSVTLSWWVVNASTATTIGRVFGPRLDAKERSVREAATLAAQTALEAAPYASYASLNRQNSASDAATSYSPSSR